MRPIDADALIEFCAERWIPLNIDAVNMQPTIQPETPCYLGSPCEYQNPDVVISQPEPQWIPVSERLPEDLSEVNVTWVNHNPELYYEFTKDKPFTATAVYYKNEWYWYSATCVDYLGEYGRCDWNKVSDVIEIIAWMPLPSPYQNGSDEDDRAGID